MEGDRCGFHSVGGHLKLKEIFVLNDLFLFGFWSLAPGSDQLVQSAHLIVKKNREQTNTSTSLGASQTNERIPLKSRHSLWLVEDPRILTGQKLHLVLQKITIYYFSIFVKKECKAISFFNEDPLPVPICRGASGSGQTNGGTNERFGKKLTASHSNKSKVQSTAILLPKTL